MPEEVVEEVAAVQREETLVWVVFNLAVISVMRAEQLIRLASACLPYMPTLLEIEAGLAALADHADDADSPGGQP